MSDIAPKSLWSIFSGLTQMVREKMEKTKRPPRPPFNLHPAYPTKFEQWRTDVYVSCISC